MKVHFDACLRLAKLFKLGSLIAQFNKNLYFLNRGSSKNSEININAEDEEFQLRQFGANARNISNGIQLTINDTDIFCNC